MDLASLLWTVAGFLLTVLILSYLFGDTILFRIAVQLFVGLSAGYWVIVLINQILWPRLLLPLFTGTGPDRLWLLVPLALVALLFLSAFSKRYDVAKIPLAFLVGLTAAIAILGAVFGTLIPQTRAILAAFDPNGWGQTPEGAWARILDAAVMLVGTVSVLGYFHFGGKLGRRHKSDGGERPLPLQVMSRAGEAFLGMTLGAVFVGVFSTALLVLIDRVAFLGETLLRWMGGG